METIIRAFFLKKQVHLVEWRLLAFLVLMMDVKGIVKIFALILVFSLNPDFTFARNLKSRKTPWFYLIVIIIALVNWIVYRYFTLNYSFALLTGIFSWMICLLAVHQLRSLVDKTKIHILHNTLHLFFILNITFSIFNLLAIFFEIGFQNPFLYQGDYQKYFINTGDYVKGISFDTSTANALINAFGIVYFLSQKKYIMVLGCMMVLILTASNFTNVILTIAFLYLFIFNSNKEQKSIMIICMICLVIFLAKFSPQNDHYIGETFKKFFPAREIFSVPHAAPSKTEIANGLGNAEEKKQRIAVMYMDSLDKAELAFIEKKKNEGIKNLPSAYAERPAIEKPSIHSPPFQSKKDTTAFQHQLLSFIYAKAHDPFLHVTNYNDRTPGKLIAFYQLAAYFKDHPQKMITGSGTGNFSSKLAFKTTGLKIAGSYPQKFIYTSNDFLLNHFAVYSFFFTKPAGAHSIMNNPASVYGQLLSEYGIAGLAAFLIFYLGFFLRHIKKMSYSLALFFLLLSAFFADYWFEQLSIVILFELMVFMDIKQHTKTPVHE